MISCYSKMSIDVNTTGKAYVGGVIGYLTTASQYDIEIRDCVALGDITATLSSGSVGAFVAYSEESPSEKITNNYSLNTQKIKVNLNGLVFNDSLYEFEIRTSMEEIKNNIPYDFE